MPFERRPDLNDLADDKTVLWRYVDLYRLLDLLQTSELHLTRVDDMEDRWEGSVSSVNIAERPRRFGMYWAPGWISSASLKKMYAYGRTHIYMNCWYMGSHESYAMWRLYDAAGKGVAIRTTAGQLRDALQGGTPIHGAQVSYVDYDVTYVPERNIFLPYMHKRKSFAYESEYRLISRWFPKALKTDEVETPVRTEPDNPPRFLRESVDLAKLIEAIYVSPDAPPWAYRVVTEVVHGYVPDVEVRQSDLVADPVY